MKNDLTEILELFFPIPENFEDNLVFKESDSNSEPEHIVILIHGIRTHAPWYEKVRSIIQNRSFISVRNAGYGYFDAIRFLIPIQTRVQPVQKVLSKIQNIKQDHPNAKMSIIAHSFGTYIFSEILKKSNIEFHRVILSGSIIKPDFEWEKYKNRVAVDINDEKILNECGTNDVWPILAKSSTIGFGASGTFGFRNPYVRDRFQKFKHSDYFKGNFIEEYWIPYILDDEDIPSNIEEDRPSPPYWQSIINLIPIWLIIMLTIVVTIISILF